VKRVLTNALLGLLLAAILIDTVPQSPLALHVAVRPLLVRLGIDQGRWNLFAPEPDRINVRLVAEITYRDGEHRTWRLPVWKDESAWAKWVRHRHVEWLDHILLPAYQAAWKPWCRHLARQARPEMPNADQGARVRIVYYEAEIPPAELRPWPGMRQPMPFDDGSVLTIEEL
jgi:hypothetical protein